MCEKYALLKSHKRKGGSPGLKLRLVVCLLVLRVAPLPEVDVSQSWGPDHPPQPEQDTADGNGFFHFCLTSACNCRRVNCKPFGLIVNSDMVRVQIGDYRRKFCYESRFKIVSGRCRWYNSGVLGISLAVGQRTLDP